MEQTEFKLESYKFIAASLNFNIQFPAELNICFIPKGVFYPKDSRYELSFDTIIKCKDTEVEIVNITCIANFKFTKDINIDDIPKYFYPNSLAILFPYIRAFVSTISLQANIQPIILPTVNLMGLTELLQEKTEVADISK